MRIMKHARAKNVGLNGYVMIMYRRDGELVKDVENGKSRK